MDDPKGNRSQIEPIQFTRPFRAATAAAKAKAKATHINFGHN